MQIRQPGQQQASNGPLKASSAPSGSQAGQGPAQAGQPAQAAPQAPQAPQGQPQDPGQGGQVQQQGSGTGFINLQNILSANQPGAEGMVNTLVDNANKLGQPLLDAQKGGGEGKQGPNPYDFAGAGAKAADYAKGLNSYGGLAQSLQQQYGKQSYNEGENALDTFLAGQAGHDKFAAAQKVYGGLGDAMASGQAPAQQSPVSYDVRPNKHLVPRAAQSPKFDPYGMKRPRAGTNYTET